MWKRLDFDALRGAVSFTPPQLHQTRSGRGPWVQLFSPRGLVWKTAELPIKHLPAALNGFRIVHLSDLHMRAFWGAGHDELLGRVNGNPPDLILFTGDFLHSRENPRPAVPFLQRLLTGCKSRLGIIGILGNHDPDWLPPYLAEIGVTILNHHRAILASHDAELELIGLTGVWRSDAQGEFARGLPSPKLGRPRIVMCHYPDGFPRARQLRPDLYLAGHTHGGQLCLPGGVPLVTHDRMPRRFRNGIHRIDHTWFIVSNGLGFSGPMLRLFCPAEAMELTLVPVGSNDETGARQTA